MLGEFVMKRLFVAGVVISCLSCCGGSGGGAPMAVGAPNLAAFNDAQAGLDTTLNVLNSFGPTPVSSMPITDTVNYSGQIQMDFDVSDSDFDNAVGDVHAAVNFDLSRLDATVNNFTPLVRRELGGELVWVATITQNQFAGSVSGQLIIDGLAQSVASNDLTGVFVGPDADGFAGTFLGNITHPTGEGGIFGAFALAKD